MKAKASGPEPVSPATPSPDYIAAGFKLLLGIALLAAAAYLFYEHARKSWNEPTVTAGVVTGTALGLSLWLLLSGGLQLRRKKWGVPRGVAVLIALIVAGGVVEPRVLQAGRVRAELDAWSALQASPGKYQDYEYYHRCTSIPRKGVAGPMALAQVREKLEKADDRKPGRVELLRRLIREFSTAAKDEAPGAMEPAIETARDGLLKAYGRGLEELAERTRAAGTAAEFPEDLRMRAAFRTILEHLALSNDDYVYLAFTSVNELGKIPGQLVDPGEAFSPDREKNRRSSFVDAMVDALRKAFTEPLVRIRILDPGEPREGKVIFDVRCTTQRVPGEFTLTQDDKAVGKLFKLEVAWDFSILDAGAKTLTSMKSRSNPAGSIQFQYKRGDPTWSAYSVMLDSAYYNYCREVTGRLGMIPPEVRKHFSFER